MFRKPLTVAALVAASAALASASDITTFTDLTTTQTIDGVTYDATKSTIYVTDTSTGSIYAQEDGSSYYSSTATFVLNMTAVTALTEQTELITFQTTVDDVDYTIGLLATSSCLLVAYTQASTTTTSTATTSSTDSDEDSGTTDEGTDSEESTDSSDDTESTTETTTINYIVDSTSYYYSYFGYEDGDSMLVLSILVNDANLGTRLMKDTGVEGDYYTSSAVKFQSVDFSETEIYVNSDLILGITIEAGSESDMSTIAARSAALLAAVPEPSAFGLLAGLAVLAFAAARRRRSR